jgi:glycosyltransferase involved in cell wall biosynthesis
MAKVLIIGPGHPLRGGLATFNQRLANEFIANGHSCELISFSLQYPNFLFPGTTQYSSEPAPSSPRIRTLINSINPFNWIKTGNRLRKEKPDLVIVRFWLPFMGPALGTILRRIKKNNHSRIICIADNVIPHEKRPGDKLFTRYFLRSCDAFITMSEKVMADLRSFEKNKPALFISHPLYDNFGEAIDKKTARNILQVPQEEKIILFFGFIRKYKGLDLLFEAMADPRIKQAGIKLLVAGEYYEDHKPFEQQVRELGIADRLILRTEFIPDAAVRNYLCAADFVIQPYRNATQSGVTPLAYHFEKPMLVTNVGGLPSLVPDGKAGLVVQPVPQSIADGILQLYQLGEQYFIPHLRNEKRKYSWSVMVSAIFQLADDIQK